MGNSLGNLEDYWHAIRTHRKLQGGFIWDWVDQAVLIKDEKGRPFWGSGFDYGPNPRGDKSIVTDGLIQADRTPNPHFYELMKVYAPIGFDRYDAAAGTVRLLNRHDMIDLSGLSVRDENTPDGDIAIQITGLRPGEKLYEELLIGNDPSPTDHPRIMKAHEEFLPWAELDVQLAILRDAVKRDDVDAIKSVLTTCVHGYEDSAFARLQ